MPYHKSELAGVPDSISGDVVSMFVGMDTMSSAQSLRTLEGMPVVVGDHCWITPANAAAGRHGNVAGAPRVEGAYIVCDLLITDPMAMADVEAGKYPEISAAYHADAQFEAGNFDGQPYDARQIGIKYNHIAVIAQGTGRGGTDVCILNKDKSKTGGRTMELVKVRLRNGKFINTDEEGADAIAEDSAASETTSKSLDASMDELAGKNEDMASLQAEIEELKGELSVYKEKLDELLSDEAIEGKAAEMNAEQAESEEILENCAIKNEKGEELPEEDKLKVKNSLKSLHGEKLHREVLTLTGMNTENMSPECVRGAFKAHVQIIRNTKNTKTVTGAKLMNSMVTKTEEVKTAEIKVRNSRERLGLK